MQVLSAEIKAPIADVIEPNNKKWIRWLTFNINMTTLSFLSSFW
ncbi:hypothetical protein M565_ctg5P1117 [Vibrio cyclitrophicus FF75]|nr:hypothetical protein M565_ctg5P1117 [Vibrio cyclitrophicus FF75]